LPGSGERALRGHDRPLPNVDAPKRGDPNVTVSGHSDEGWTDAGDL